MKVDYKKRYEQAVAKLNEDAEVIAELRRVNVKQDKRMDDAQAYITELAKQRDQAVGNFETAKMIADTNAKACVERGNSLERSKVVETGLRKALEQQANVIEGLRYDIVTISEAWQCDVDAHKAKFAKREKESVQDIRNLAQERSYWVGKANELRDDHTRLTQEREEARSAYLWMRFVAVVELLIIVVCVWVSSM